MQYRKAWLNKHARQLYGSVILAQKTQCLYRVIKLEKKTHIGLLSLPLQQAMGNTGPAQPAGGLLSATHPS